MLSKIYAAQPYYAGGANRKHTLVFCIPSKIVKECNINISTIFAMRVASDRKSIVLQILEAPPADDLITDEQ
jgi:hypothetical protein